MIARLLFTAGLVLIAGVIVYALSAKHPIAAATFIAINNTVLPIIMTWTMHNPNGGEHHHTNSAYQARLPLPEFACVHARLSRSSRRKLEALWVVHGLISAWPSLLGPWGHRPGLGVNNCPPFGHSSSLPSTYGLDPTMATSQCDANRLELDHALGSAQMDAFHTHTASKG